MLDMTKTLVLLALKNISCHCCTKWHHCVSEPPSLVWKAVQNEEASSSCWCQYPFFTIANSHYACIHKQMSNVLWSFKMIRFSHDGFVLSNQNLSFRSPDLSLPATSTKLLIKDVASWTGSSTPACNILSNSCLKASFTWRGIGQQGVYFGVTLHYDQVVYGMGDLGIFQSHQRYWGSFPKSSSRNQLGNYIFSWRHCAIFSWVVNSYLTLCLLRAVYCACNQASSLG